MIDFILCFLFVTAVYLIFKAGKHAGTWMAKFFDYIKTAIKK